MGNPYFQILDARKVFSASSPSQIISYVRSTLLDFILKLDDEFGSTIDINELKKHNDIIKTILYQTIITTGDGNILNTGDNSNITASIHINSGNVHELQEALRRNLMSEEDIKEIVHLVEFHTLDEQGNYSEPIKIWIKSLLAKAVDGTWQIGIGAAGSILADVLQKFYNK
jgi:hypothetical protein